MTDAGMTAVVDAVTGAMTAAATADPGTADSIGEVIGSLGQVLGDWQAGGWMAGIAAAIVLLLRVSKLPMLDGLLGKKPWIRPLIAAVLGAGSGALMGLPGGVLGVLGGAVKGLLAGLGAIGGHTLYTRTTVDGAAEVKIMRAVRETLASSDAAATEKSKTMGAAIDGAMRETDKKKRMTTLAALANGAVP